jgi:hypothetical protein
VLSDFKDVEMITVASPPSSSVYCTCVFTEHFQRAGFVSSVADRSAEGGLSAQDNIGRTVGWNESNTCSAWVAASLVCGEVLECSRFRRWNVIDVERRLNRSCIVWRWPFDRRRNCCQSDVDNIINCFCSKIPSCSTGDSRCILAFRSCIWCADWC